MSRRPLQGKTALVTGAAQRLGRDLALALADEGVHVVIHYRRSADAAGRLGEELTARGVKHWLVPADFDHEGEIVLLMDRALAAAGAIDILIHNASSFAPSTLADLTWDRLRADIQVNAWAPLKLSQEFARRAGHGDIIYLLHSSITAYNFSHLGYHLSKQLLWSVLQAGALAYAPAIRVNGVAPGLILAPEGKDESYLAPLAEKLPLRRHGEPGQVSDAVIFLLKNSFITGEVIRVDGGRHLRDALGE